MRKSGMKKVDGEEVRNGKKRGWRKKREHKKWRGY